MDFRKELIERLGVPPAVHVGFTGAVRALREYALIEAIVVNLNVPGIVTVDLDTGALKHINDLLCGGRMRNIVSSRAAMVVGTLERAQIGKLRLRRIFHFAS